MQYNGFYFWMFKGSMKRVLEEKYDKSYAAKIMKMSKAVYRQIVDGAEDIGKDNPMAYNELFALAFVAPYIASEKKDPARDDPGNDAKVSVLHQMVFCQNRSEHRKGQAGEQKEHRKVRKMVHPGKRAAVSGVL